ncbi:hypothetical protein DFA_02805 [Cavenderia fasciculata]|uniref:Ankyrin repeat-containing protein n=1 Tax=Cavenderia fasciculata TaxID=261658 RepID=F4PIC8_CACFS|nr:uncharacterized protein DFA_02805 [Cavenderia fasciculata]EGG24562.1 hypothetical protein DFA_02805 [Cavenderia fasciculata]|eukprot:XP_004362413.1 hypothetical protein DFA_02805 [Cavenderia fasciculata]
MKLNPQDDGLVFNNNNNHNKSSSNNAIEPVFNNCFLFRKIVGLVQSIGQTLQHQQKSYRYNELPNARWVLENGYEKLLKLLSDRGELAPLWECDSGIELFFTKIKDRQLLLSIYHRDPLFFCGGDCASIEYACLRGDVEIVKMMVDQVKPFELPIGDNALSYAIQSNSFELVDYLYDHHVTIGARRFKHSNNSLSIGNLVHGTWQKEEEEEEEEEGYLPFNCINFKTTNLEMIQFVLAKEDKQAATHKVAKIQFNLESLLGHTDLLNWVLANHLEKCIWGSKSSRTLAQIQEEVEKAVTKSTNAIECAEHLSKSLMPFKAIYQSIKQIVDMDLESNTVAPILDAPIPALQERIKGEEDTTDPIYYPMAILTIWDCEWYHQAVMAYLVKTDHPILYALEENDVLANPGSFLFTSECILTIKQARHVYERLRITPTCVGDSLGTFNYMEGWDFSSDMIRMDFSLRQFNVAIHQCNFAMVRLIADNGLLFGTRTNPNIRLAEDAKIAFSLHAKATRQDYIDMSKLLFENSHFARKFGPTTIEHPTEYFTDYILQCLSYLPSQEALYCAMSFKGDYILREYIRKERERNPYGIGTVECLGYGSESIQQTELAIASLLGGDVYRLYGDYVNILWDDLHSMLFGVVLLDMDKFYLFKVLIDYMEMKSKQPNQQQGLNLEHIASTVSAYGRSEHIKEVLSRFKVDKKQMIWMQKAASESGKRSTLQFLIEHTQCDETERYHFTTVKQNNYLLKDIKRIEFISDTAKLNIDSYLIGIIDQYEMPKYNNNDNDW